VKPTDRGGEGAKPLYRQVRGRSQGDPTGEGGKTLALCTCYTTNNPLEEGRTTHLFTGEENS